MKNVDRYCHASRKEEAILDLSMRLIKLDKFLMYLMGGLDRDIGRYVGRCIGRYVGHYSVEYRSSIGRHSAEISADNRSSIGRVSIYTSADMCVDRYGSNLVDARPIPYRHFTDSLPIPYRHSVDTRSVYDLKPIWRRSCQKKGVFRFRIFFFVDITRMLYQVLGVVVFQLTRRIVMEHIECNKGTYRMGYRI